MAVDLIRAMNESESLVDLEARLKESGHEFHNYRDYINWLDGRWKQISLGRINQVLESPPAETVFPTLTVEADGIEYQLHGIAHGSPAEIAPGWQPRGNIKNYVSETMCSFRDPEGGEDYLYEQNLDFFFDLLKSQELEDHKHTNGSSGSLLKDIWMTALFIPVCITARIVLPVFFGGMYIYSKRLRNPQGAVQGLSYLTRKALADEKYLSKLVDFQLALEMPQPFNLEKSYLSEKGYAAYIILNLTSMEPHAATSGERSLWTAREMRNYASSRRLAKLHYLCGFGHTTEIAYFLQNPNFSFETLKEYRLSRR